MDNMIIDCFAGGGGASVGIEMALGRPAEICKRPEGIVDVGESGLHKP